jgi:hypothetical protein
MFNDQGGMNQGRISRWEASRPLSRADSMSSRPHFQSSGTQKTITMKERHLANLEGYGFTMDDGDASFLAEIDEPHSGAAKRYLYGTGRYQS